MNAVDGSDHYSTTTDEPPPSLLTIVLDTNPHAWALLSTTLPLSSFISSLLIFINAHLSFNNSNQIAIIASHVQRASFLYPVPTSQTPALTTTTNTSNTYLPFSTISTTLLSTLPTLFSNTTPSSLTPQTSLSGALTLAQTYISKLTITAPTLTSRVLLISLSGDLSSQYIPLMNTIFSSQRLQIPVDILKLSGDSTFLQQASDATRGVYMHAEDPRGILQYLMMGFLADGTGRKNLVMPGQVGVDFRAACFCHRRVVDVGFVCSICLSIFCSPPDDSICLTCGTHLEMGNYGGKPAVVARKKKKRKRIDGVNGIGGS